LMIAISVIVLQSCGGNGLPKQREVKVSTAQELMSAIANDTKILVDTKDIIELEKGIVLDSISNLTIEGVGKELVHVRVADAYENVFTIQNSSNIRIANLKLGHLAPRGSCEGDVVFIDNSSNVDISGCKLYGCGLEGIVVYSASNLSISTCEIYECSDEAIDIHDYHGIVDNVKISHCSIHDCGDAFSVFHSSGNEPTYSIKNIVLDNCDISCYIKNEYGQIYSNVPVTFNNCNIRTADDFTTETKSFLTLNNCNVSRIDPQPSIKYSEDYVYPTFELSEYEEYEGDYSEENQGIPPAFTDFECCDESKLNVVRVSDLRSFVDALRSNTRIIIESDNPIHLLNECPEIGDTQFRISDLENVVIEGAGKNGAKLVVDNSYEDVMQIENCKNIVLRNLTLGHDVEPGSCTGDVVELSKCNGVVVDNCKLFGCGVVGFSSYLSQNIKVMSTDIYECSEKAVALYNSSNVIFLESVFRDCPHAIGDYGEDENHSVTFTDCIFSNIQWGFFEVEKWGVTVKNCKGIQDMEPKDNVVILSE